MHLYVIIRFICSFRGIHDCLVPVTPYLAGLFKYVRTKSKLPPRVRAMNKRKVLLILLFLLEGLLTEEVEEHTTDNRRNPVAQIVNPSPMMARMEITIILLSWYQSTTLSSKISCKGWRRYQGLRHPWREVKCMHILHIFNWLTYIAYNKHPVLIFRFLRRCVELFPYRNKRGDLLVATEKMHSIKHVPNHNIRWADPENMSC